MVHSTQKSYITNLNAMEGLILSLGGILRIEKDLGLGHFKYFAAKSLGCTPAKALHYFDVLKRASIAAKVIDSYRKKHGLSVEEPSLNR